MSLAVLREQRSRSIEVRVVPQAREDIEHLPAAASRIEDAAGRENGQLMARGKLTLRTDQAIFAPVMLTLEFYVDAILAERLRESIQDLVGRSHFTVSCILPQDCTSERTVFIASQRH